MPALYRQYRPQTFSEIVGQDHIVKTLQQAIEQDRLSHAYLFQGPRGTGKTTTARLLAKRLNCTKAKNWEPCGKCELCRAAQNNQNIDIIEIDAASSRGIDDIRALRENIALSPAMSKYKVYIIDEVHMLTNEAFAALLKTLEEPVKHAVFILATTELHKVPSTILSRCQVYRFRRASAEEMKQRLNYILEKEGRSADEKIVEFITNRSDGCYRDAESLLEQLLTMQKEEIKLDEAMDQLGLPSPQQINNFLLALVENNITKAVGITDEVYSSGIDPEQFIQEAIWAARDGSIAIYRKSDQLPDFANNPAAPQRLPVIIRSLIQAKQDLAFVPQPLIALQLAVLTSCTPVRIAASAPTSQTNPVKAQPVPALTVSSAPRPTATKVEPSVSDEASTKIEEVIKVWPLVIDHIKSKNPVASTFLRAIEPSVIENGVVKLKVQFPLHLNFFTKPENKKIVEETVNKLTNKKFPVSFALDNRGYGDGAVDQNKVKEEELLKNVQDVFGVKAS